MSFLKQHPLHIKPTLKNIASLLMEKAQPYMAASENKFGPQNDER